MGSFPCDVINHDCAPTNGVPFIPNAVSRTMEPRRRRRNQRAVIPVVAYYNYWLLLLPLLLLLLLQEATLAGGFLLPHHHHHRQDRVLLKPESPVAAGAGAAAGVDRCDNSQRTNRLRLRRTRWCWGFHAKSGGSSSNEQQQQKPEDVDDPNDTAVFSDWLTSSLKSWPMLPAPTATTATTTTATTTTATTTTATTATNSTLTQQQSPPQPNKTTTGIPTIAEQPASNSSLLEFSSLESMYSSGRNSTNNINTMNTNNSLPRTKFLDLTTRINSPLSRVFSIEALLQLTVSSATVSSSIAAAAASAVISGSSSSSSNIANSSSNSTGSRNWTATLEELGSLDQWIGGMMQTTGKSAEGLLKQGISRMEALVAEASSVVSPEMIEALIRTSTETVFNVTTATASTATGKGINNNNNKNLLTGSSFYPDETASLLKEKSTSESTTYAMTLLRTADGLFRKGYVAGDPVAAKVQQSKQSILQNIPVFPGSRALFSKYRSAVEVSELSSTLIKAAEMGALAGAVYEDTVSRTRALDHTIVARGTTADVAWMVTDSIANPSSFPDSADEREAASFLTRTITIRGFDASDESVDRELLLNRICTANPVAILDKWPDLLVHSGLLGIARAIYRDVKQYVDWTATSHKIVLNGHSVGGSISLLLLFLLIQDNGTEYVKRNVIQVYTFGCPPVAVIKGTTSSVLQHIETPPSLVQGYIQPWDPIVRLFSQIDSLYPLVGDLGPDNMTPFANGPPRTLRPILKAMIESWAGWPRFRTNYKGTANQTYVSVGVQHLLLPDPTRYLADRFAAVNIPVPPVETVLRISDQELYPALSSVFPLDVFEVSFVPQAIRSFVHHFYPAYGSPLVDYVKDLQRKSSSGELVLPEKSSESTSNGVSKTTDSGIDWSKATQWLVGNNAKP